MKGRKAASSDSSELDVPLRQLKREQQQQQQQQQQQNEQQTSTGPSGMANRGGLSRHRCVSDGAVADSHFGAQRSHSPASNNPLLPVMEGAEAILQPPSPGTPPKKLWERQYGSFLRNKLHPHRRQRSTGSVNTTASNSTASISPASLLPIMPSVPVDLKASKSDSNHSSNSSNSETPVRGGNFFASVFRPNSSSSISNHQNYHHSSSDNNDLCAHNESAKGSRSMTSARRVKSMDADELDGTLRRGSEKAYTPTNRRYMNPLAAAAPPAPPLFVAPIRKPPSTSRTLDRSSHSSIKKVFTDFHNTAGGDANSAYLGDEPSYRGSGGFWVAQQNQELAVPNATSSSHSTTAAKYYQKSKSVPRFRGLALETVDELRLKSSSGTNCGRVAHTQRVLKQIVGVEAWQTGRRYLIAPAALAACPASVLETLLGSFEDYTSVEDASIAIAQETASPFQTILLGECHLAYTHNSAVPEHHRQQQQQHSQEPQWSSAVLVLCQNYLLEYAFDADVGKEAPRGYCHLQYATIELHADFQDCLELHFYGSPCAKADARVLMIRIVHPPSPKYQQHRNNSKSNTGSNDDERQQQQQLDASSSSIILDASAHRQVAMLVRSHWKACLQRAAALTSISDLYEVNDNDSSTLLGTGQYAHVRAARRRTSNGSNNTTDTAPSTASETDSSTAKGDAADQSSSKYDCALKIFDKNKFWRMVVKGRERADTIVRETAVQATLSSHCQHEVNSFLQIRGFFETSDSIVLELELLEGTDLFQYIGSKNVLPEAEAAAILRDILRGLDAMNRIGLAHRDVKPANILMCSLDDEHVDDARGAPPDASANDIGQGDVIASSMTKPRVKLGDFGMAAFVGVDGHIRGRCGTPGYVAPEVFRAGIYGGYGNKVDVFSAGVTLYVMLCGYEPFYGETDAELVDSNKAAVVDFPSEDWDHISTKAKDLVRKMMKASASDRLSAREALQHPWFAAQLKDCKPPASSRIMSHRRKQGLEDTNKTDLSSAPRKEDACSVS